MRLPSWLWPKLLARLHLLHGESWGSRAAAGRPTRHTASFNNPLLHTLAPLPPIPRLVAEPHLHCALVCSRCPLLLTSTASLWHRAACAPHPRPEGRHVVPWPCKLVNIAIRSSGGAERALERLSLCLLYLHRVISKYSGGPERRAKNHTLLGNKPETKKY